MWGATKLTRFRRWISTTRDRLGDYWEQHESFAGLADDLLILLMGIGALFGAVASFSFLVIGFWEMGRAAVKYFSEYDSQKEVLYLAISGIEFLLLAPLGFLVLRVLGRYVEDMKSKGKMGASAKKSLLEVKAFSVGLLFAVVATDIVGKLVGGNKGDAFGFTEAFTSFGFLLILGTFFFGLEYFATREEGAAEKEEQRRRETSRKSKQRNQEFMKRLNDVLRELQNRPLSAQIYDPKNGQKRKSAKGKSSSKRKD